MSEQKLQRKTDKYVISARELSSRGMSFIIVMLGVVLQAAHTTLLMYNVSSFSQEWLKITVGLGVGVFISSALAIFTLKYDGKNKDVGQIITVFFYFEIFTNVFYYWNSLIFSKGFDNATTQNWLYLIIAMPFSFIMPFAIKKFAGVISADERLLFGSIDATVEQIVEHEHSLLKAVNDCYTDLEQEVQGIKDKLSNFNPDEYLKTGHNVEITVGDKRTVVSLDKVTEQASE